MTLTARSDLFSKITMLQKRSIALKSIFGYPLTPLPMSLVEADGTLNKKQSQFFNINQRKMLLNL